MLKLSRLGRRPMELRDVELSALAAEVAEELRAAQPERDVEVLIEPNVSAVGDRELLRVALQNLLANAFKFTSQRPHARVEFGRTEHAGQAAIFVRDNGVGFDVNNADKLFRPFERRTPSASSAAPGSGWRPCTALSLATADAYPRRAPSAPAPRSTSRSPQPTTIGRARSGPSCTDCARGSSLQTRRLATQRVALGCEQHCWSPPSKPRGCSTHMAKRPSQSSRTRRPP